MPSPTRAICLPSITALALSLLGPFLPRPPALERLLDRIEAPGDPTQGRGGQT